MPQDAYTLRYLCEELNSILKGGKINKIVEPNLDEIIFTVYTGKKTEKLYISVNPSSPKIGLTDIEKESPLTAPNFCMLLRKHLLNATVNSVSLVGFDRIVKIELTPTAEFFDAEKKTLFIELMGRYSNVVLTENGKVLGGNRGINLFDNGIRPLIVGKDYNLPPVGDKKTPYDFSLTEIFSEYDGNDFPVFLTETVQGIAISTAKVIFDSYRKEIGEFEGKKFYEYLNSFIKRESSPRVYLDDNGVVDVCATDYGYDKEYKEFKSLYLAENYYFGEKDRIKTYNEKKQRLSSIVKTALKKSDKRLSAVNSRLKDAESAEDSKIKADLILSNLYRIKNGEKKCVLENFYDDNKEIEIELDENLSPSDNAESYYKKYNKGKRATAILGEQKAIAESESDYLKSVFDEIEIAEDITSLKSVESELAESGYIKKFEKKGGKKKEPTPYAVYIIDGFTVRRGRNNVENDRATFSAKPTDIWLHVKDYHSAHLVIETSGKEVKENTIEKAAEICAYYSKARNGGKAEVSYTFKKFVKKPPKSKLGFCIYSDFKSVTVNPNKHDEFLKSE